MNKSDMNYPMTLDKIKTDTACLGFTMTSEPKTGALLSTLAASKPGSRFLELGTGTGVSAAWLLHGMDKESRLVSVDNDAKAQVIAIEHLHGDLRVEFICDDAESFLQKNQNTRFDFIFADTWAGKFTHLDLALNLLNDGGLYIIDDLLPQDNWPEGHAAKIPVLVEALKNKANLNVTYLDWSTGIIIACKIHHQPV